MPIRPLGGNPARPLFSARPSGARPRRRGAGGSQHPIRTHIVYPSRTLGPRVSFGRPLHGMLGLWLSGTAASSPGDGDRCAGRLICSHGATWPMPCAQRVTLSMKGRCRGMEREREALLERLKRFGEENDARVTDRADKMLNITRDTGLLLWMVLRAMKPAQVLEIGTSNGYSTIWWADALSDAAQELVTLEINPKKAELARRNFKEAGVESRVTLLVEDAGSYLKRAPTESVDFLFLDSERGEYVGWWPDLQRVLAPRGLLVVDNAVDKAAELVAFRERVAATAGVSEVLVPIGNGELFIQKTAG